MLACLLGLLEDHPGEASNSNLPKLKSLNPPNPQRDQRTAETSTFKMVQGLKVYNF